MERLKSSKEILEEYLKLKHPEYKTSFEVGNLDANLQFLAEYCIEKKNKDSNDRLEKKHIYAKSAQYFGEKDNKKYPGIIRDEIQDIYTRFHEKEKKYKKAFGEPTEFNEHSDDSWYPFLNFMDWWIGKIEKKASDSEGKLYCYYCGVDEMTVKNAFDQGKISSKKRSFSGKLQIDRMNPPTEENSTEDSDGGYNHDNCVFACVLCNNAKSDMIEPENFKKFVAPGIRNYWEKIKKDSNI